MLQLPVRRAYALHTTHREQQVEGRHQHATLHPLGVDPVGVLDGMVHPRRASITICGPSRGRARDAAAKHYGPRKHREHGHALLSRVPNLRTIRVIVKCSGP